MAAIKLAARGLEAVLFKATLMLYESGLETTAGSVMEVIRQAGTTRAYTTVKTVMDRMTAKGLFVRERVPYRKFYRYLPTCTRQEYLMSEMAPILKVFNMSITIAGGVP